MKDEVKQGTKETGYNVNYKQPLTEQMVLPTPPLPPWKGRKRVQRSYSSEMLTSDSYYNVNEYYGGEAETRGTKETGYNVNYKQPLTEQMVLPTPPLPPWKGRKRVQRSYSSEMLTSDSYYNVNEYYGGEAETRQLPTESSGYHSGSLSKQKSTTATGKVSFYLT